MLDLRTRHHAFSASRAHNPNLGICKTREGKLYKARSLLAGWLAGLGYRMNHQKLMLSEISSGPRKEKRDNPHTRLTGLGAGLVPSRSTEKRK